MSHEHHFVVSDNMCTAMTQVYRCECGQWAKRDFSSGGGVLQLCKRKPQTPSMYSDPEYVAERSRRDRDIIEDTRTRRRR